MCNDCEKDYETMMAKYESKIADLIADKESLLREIKMMHENKPRINSVVMGDGKYFYACQVNHINVSTDGINIEIINPLSKRKSK